MNIDAPQQSVNPACKTRKKPTVQTIFRNAAPGAYTSISNQLLQCKGLAADVRGFVCTLLSFPRDWAFNYAWAEDQFGMGERKLKRIIRDAKAAGFMKTVREHNAGGVFTGNTLYLFTDVPHQFSPLGGDESTVSAVLPSMAKCHPGQNATDGEKAPHTKETQNLEMNESLARPTDGAKYSALAIDGAGKGKSAYPDAFEAFWAQYPRKAGKAPAAKLWAKMSAYDRQAALEGIEPYRGCKRVQDGFVLQGNNYLKNRTWEDFLPSEVAGDPQASLWQNRLKLYAQRRDWPAQKWGPRPGDDGCLVPQALQERLFQAHPELRR
jgi:hypothetical protein